LPRDKALGVYDALLRFAPNHVEANYQSALLLMQKGLYRASLNHLARLPAEAQNHSQALSVQCGDYAGLGQGDKAEQAASRRGCSALEGRGPFHYWVRHEWTRCLKEVNEKKVGALSHPKRG